MLLLAILSLIGSQHKHLAKMDFNEITPKEDVKDVKAKLTADFVENQHKHQQEQEQQQIEDIHYPS